MMDGLTDEDARKLYLFTRRLRDKLAIEINNGGGQDVQRAAGEFRAVCEILNRVKPVFHDQGDKLPPGVEVDRRQVRRLN